MDVFQRGYLFHNAVNTVLFSGQIWSHELSKWSGKKGGNVAPLYV